MGLRLSLQLSKHFAVSLIFHLLFHLLDSQNILIIIPCSGEAWQGQVQEIWVQENLPGPKVMVHVTKQHSGHLEFSFGFFGGRTDADFRPGLTPSHGDGDGDAVTRGKSCVGQESHGHGWQGAGRRAECVQRECGNGWGGRSSPAPAREQLRAGGEGGQHPRPVPRDVSGEKEQCTAVPCSLQDPGGSGQTKAPPAWGSPEGRRDGISAGGRG